MRRALLIPPLKGEGRREAPGWGDSHRAGLFLGPHPARSARHPPPSGEGLRKMRRREFISLLAGAAAWPLAARAQQGEGVRRIGYLTLAPGPSARQSGAFEQGLRELGYTPGGNITIEYRWAAGRLERLPTIAEELVRLKPAVIVGASTPVVKALQNATKSVPIVIVHSADPVATGFAASLAKPGGNITGLSVVSIELAPKRIELLHELLPGIARVAFLAHGTDPAAGLFIKETQVAVDKVGLKLQPVVVKGPEGFKAAFSAMVRERADVVIVQPIFLQVGEYVQQILDLALKNRLPSVSDGEEFAARGGLMSYGASRSALFRRAATYVDRILKGTSPADLPIEQPTRFELGINLKTAKELGLSVPPALLARADEVIE
jgi:putative ABC transport system substrate-binding protein